ncbi:MAG TPA: hypothetical protein VI215_13700, partial [Bacteroidota bacterium]
SGGFEVAASMRRMIDSLDMSQKNAAFLIDEAEQRGMEVSEAKFKLREARQARLQSRTMVHSVDEQRFRGVVEKGLVAAAVVAGDGRQAIDEYYFRRWGLGVATLIITIVGVSLYLLIKRIERRQERAQKPS